MGVVGLVAKDATTGTPLKLTIVRQEKTARREDQNVKYLTVTMFFTVNSDSNKHIQMTGMFKNYETGRTVSMNMNV